MQVFVQDPAGTAMPISDRPRTLVLFTGLPGGRASDTVSGCHITIADLVYQATPMAATINGAERIAWLMRANCEAPEVSERIRVGGG